MPGASADRFAACGPADLPWASLAGPLVAAEDMLARLDERLRAGAAGEGWIARSHFADACASLWIEGELVALEDLVLHDAGMDIHAPTPQLIRARAIVGARRLIAAQPSGWALSPEGFARLHGEGERPQTRLPGAEIADARAPEATAENAALDSALALIDVALARSAQVLAGEARAEGGMRREPLPAADPDDAAQLAAWQRMAAVMDGLPPVIAAGLLWDAWETAPPVRRGAWLGRQIVADYLRQRGKTLAHLPCLNTGLRLSPWERRRSPDRATRLAAWCEAVRACAAAGLREHDRLTLAISLLERKCANRRTTSRLPALIALATRRPLVTAGTVAQALAVSPRAAQGLIAELGLRETTGRGRYRAWAL
ncbi:RHE_PE00001 family protein [Pseudochelatococcus lubricantis]|uniref:RHE_PE00001 family protein n=1 Tax=Pseudochelatococcus lubricantis TaxID=1538102 RepID=UPI0035EB73F7